MKSSRFNHNFTDEKNYFIVINDKQSFSVNVYEKFDHDFTIARIILGISVLSYILWVFYVNQIILIVSEISLVLSLIIYLMDILKENNIENLTLLSKHTYSAKYDENMEEFQSEELPNDSTEIIAICYFAPIVFIPVEKEIK